MNVTPRRSKRSAAARPLRLVEDPIPLAAMPTRAESIARLRQQLGADSDADLIAMLRIQLGVHE